MSCSVPVPVSFLDLTRKEIRARVNALTSLDIVPALLVVYSDGEGELYKGLNKCKEWLTYNSTTERDGFLLPTRIKDKEEENKEDEFELPEWEPVQPDSDPSTESRIPSGGKEQMRAMAESRVRQSSSDLMERAKQLQQEAERDRGYPYEPSQQ